MYQEYHVITNKIIEHTVSSNLYIRSWTRCISHNQSKSISYCILYCL